MSAWSATSRPACPTSSLPDLDPAILQELAPGALAIVLVGYAEALGGAKAAAMQGGGDIDPNQELIAHGPANILSGLFGGFLVVGSLSKTSVAMAAGARTQLANLVAAVFCFLTLVLLTPLFRGMPHPALAAIVIAAMLHLSKPGYLRDLLARSRWEFALAAIVIAGELTLGVLQGIALGVVLSLLMLIYRTSHPQGAVLGQLPGTEAYRDVRRHPEALTFPGLLIWRAGGDLFFASIGHLDEGLKAALAASRPPAKHVLLDAEFGELHRHHRLRRAAERHQGVARPRHHLRLRPCARPGARADAARGHRGCRRPGQLPRTRDRRRARLAAEQTILPHARAEGPSSAPSSEGFSVP